MTFSDKSVHRILFIAALILLCIPQLILEFFASGVSRHTRDILLAADAAGCLAAVAAAELFRRKNKR